jgi:hypothetical protein
MINTPPFSEQVLKAFKPTTRGVVGLVDDLLSLCRSHQLRIDFQDGHCFARSLGMNTQDSLKIPLPKSVFRAVLARFAALCNDNLPKSVTPYRGEAEIVVPELISDPAIKPSTCYVSFTNTPSEQRLELRFSRSSVSEGSRFTVLLSDKRTVTVFGHALQYVENPSNSADYGSYGILSLVAGEERIIALFRVSDVVGVFNGEIHEPVGV